MSTQRFLINGKKYCQHPVYSNYAASKDSEILNITTERILRTSENNCGYYKFFICDKKLKKPKCYLQHRFDYESVKGLIPEGFEINHKNEAKTDNRIKNFEILTHKENIEKSLNKLILSINLQTSEKKLFVSIKIAAIKLEICAPNILSICKIRKYFKSATSKNDGNKYTFEYVT